MNPMKATVSGSFRKFIGEVERDVERLRDFGVLVLSPAEPAIVDILDEFVFVKSDRSRSPRLVQGRHFNCIAASDFLWLVAPDGYVGTSASMEIGWAIARNVPVYSATVPRDFTLRMYVQVTAIESLLYELLETPGNSTAISPNEGIRLANSGISVAQNPSQLCGLNPNSPSRKDRILAKHSGES